MYINQQRSGYGAINFEYSGRNIYKNYSDKYTKYIFEIKSITLHSRYVDDIPIVHDPLKFDPEIINSNTNQVHNNIIFSGTYEDDGQINVLDLLLIWNEPNIHIDIYRKPTSIDITINFFSNRPTEHKMAAYRYYITRMQSLPVSLVRKQKEWIAI
jgi:hypothetical protein